MVMLANQGSQQKQINLSSPFSHLSQDPTMQQGLLGNWAFNMANRHGGRSFFENFANFPQQNQGGGMFGQQNNVSNTLQDWSGKLLSAYDNHLSTPNLQADILFNDTYMGGNGNKKQDVGWGLLG